MAGDIMTYFYSGYNSFVDKVVNFDLYISWLDPAISWFGIVGLGFLAYYMAKIVVKNL